MLRAGRRRAGKGAFGLERCGSGKKSPPSRKSDEGVNGLPSCSSESEGDFDTAAELTRDADGGDAALRGDNARRGDTELLQTAHHGLQTAGGQALVVGTGAVGEA